MAAEKINSYLDIPALQKETAEFLSMFGALKEQYANVSGLQFSFKGAEKTKDVTTGITKLGESVDSLAVKLEGASVAQEKLSKTSKDNAQAVNTEAQAVGTLSEYYAALIKQSVQNQQASKQLSAQRKDLTASFTAGTISQQQYQDGLEKIRLEELRLSASNADLNRALRNLTKGEQEAEGSLNALRAELNLSLQAFDRLSRADLVGPEGDALKQHIAELTKEISKQEQETGRFQRNVGNYSGAVSILKKSFDEVSAKIQALSKDENANRDVLAQLEKEYTLLNQLINSQEAGFANATQEIRANQKALIELEAAGLRGTETFDQLAKKTGELQDQVGDLRARTKALGSDTFVFDGLINAAQGLAGVYGVAQGAAALFGDQNEELQKTFVKLQAVMTVIQGLQAISNTLQAENSAMLLLSTVRTKALAAAETVWAFATAGASTALKVLRGALVTTGIGALVVALGYAISKLMDLAEGSSEASKRQSDLEDAVKGASDALNQQADVIAQVNRELVRTSKDQLALAEQRGASEAELLRLRQKVAEDELKINQQSLADRELTENKLIVLEGDRNLLLEQRAIAEQKLAEAQKANDEDHITSFTRIINETNKQIDVVNSKLIPGTEAYNKVLDSQLEIQKIAAQRQKFYTEERQKQMQAERAGLQLQADAAQEVASNEENGLKDRINALKQYEITSIAITKNQRDEQLLDSSLSIKGRFLIEKQSQADILKVQRETQKQTLQLQKEYDQRERAAQLEILKMQIQDRVNLNNIIIDNDKNSYSERLQALSQSYQNQKSIYQADRDFQLQNAALTSSEREQIEKQYQSNILSLNTAFGQKQLEIVQANQAQITEELNNVFEQRKLLINKAQNDEIVQLTEQLSNGTVGIETFNKKRAEIEQRYSIETAAEAVKNSFAVMVATKEGTKERLDAETDLADKTKALADDVANYQKEKNQKVVDDIQQAYSTIADVVSKAVDINITSQKNAVQDQIDAIDERTKKEIDAVNATTDAEEKKAAKIQLIQARAAAEKQALDRKQKQLDQQKAIFDKANAIMQIILNTAVSISKDLGNPLKVAFDAALGAAQLAVAIATPIPRFKHGKNKDNYEGFGYVGDGGRREAIIRENGNIEITPAVPTVTFLKSKDIVLPDANEVLKDLEPWSYKMLQPVPAASKSSQTDIIRAYSRFTKDIVTAIENKPTANIYAGWHGISIGWKNANKYWEWHGKNMQSEK